MQKTLSNPKRETAIVQKIALQINCKLGGELWSCVTPFKGMMVVGIDVFLGGSVAGIVSTLNDDFSKFFSKVVQKTDSGVTEPIIAAFKQVGVELSKVEKVA